MGNVHAEITLRNITDCGKVREGLIGEEAIRSVTVKALVDTGAMTLCINEETRQKLGVEVVKTLPVRVANGERVISHVTDPVEIVWKDRSSACRAVVIPGAELTLLGVIPLEEMDLTVNPVERELVGIHGDEWVTYVV